MREIKFRAWDKEDKTMIIDEQNFIPLKITNKGVLRLNPKYKDDLWEIIDKDRFVILEYTGIKDINGVEIYEGDILKCWVVGRKYQNYIVKWSASEGTYKAYDNDDVYYIDCVSWSKQEVIGNIYENPELLEGK